VGERARRGTDDRFGGNGNDDGCERGGQNEEAAVKAALEKAVRDRADLTPEQRANLLAVLMRSRMCRHEVTTTGKRDFEPFRVETHPDAEPITVFRIGTRRPNE